MSAPGEESAKRLHEALQKAWLDFEPQTRQLEKEQFECNASCAGKTSLDRNQYQDCLQRCSTKVAHFSKLLQTELTSLQNRYVRCIQSCKDAMDDQMNGAAAPTAAQEAQFGRCADTCAQTHQDLIPQVMQRLANQLKQ
eukprot:m.265335 g.265335  ORF g.265335 m.265335 type:complete len:139 (+) comp28930_c0_seq1:70-486(+)